MSGTEKQVLEQERPVANDFAEEMQRHSYACPLCGGAGVVPFLTAPDRFHLRTELYHLLRCSSCSAVWLDSPPRPDQMDIHYDDDYHRAIMTAGETNPEARWRRHRELIARHKQGGAILDIGCSSGAFLGAVKSPSWKLYGIEMEASTAQRARAATGAEVFVGDVDDAPFAPNSFDVITAFDLLEHVYRPRQFLGNVLNWLKPGGIFFTMLPNIDSWESRMFGSYWYGLELPRHLFHFSPKSLRHVMLSLGFQEVSLSTSEVTYVERSVGYLSTEALKRTGFSPDSPAKAGQGSIPWRALRKLIRLTLLNPFGHVASMAGGGANIEAIFRKGSTAGSRMQGQSGK
jgi:2-polyprenyl-3-methyl-5-hydroxy-6-metoxy-1,4-benzoquinol methylase